MRAFKIGVVALVAVAALSMQSVCSDDAKNSASKDEKADLQALIKKTGLTKVERMKIWEEFCAADDRAIWESARLYSQADENEKHLSEYKKRLDRYNAAVVKKHKLTKEAEHAIGAEALEEMREPPPFPSFDVLKAAKEIKVDVYAKPGDKTYHRKNCEIIAGENATKLSLHKALTTKRSRACAVCIP